jgi:hypothetical protein
MGPTAWRRKRNMMTESELVAAIRDRISDPRLRREIGASIPPPIFPPATSAAIDEAEKELGFPIPSLLRRLYQEVGNGGFGPGYGLLGVAGGYTDEGRSLSASYLELRPGWPEGILPVFDLGCAAWLCIDGPALSDQVLMVHEPGMMRTVFTLPALLEAWVRDVDLNSELFEPGEEFTFINPFTHEAQIFKNRGHPKGVLIWRIPE